MADGERSRPPSWLAPLTVVLLGLATILAFGYSQRLKREPLVVDRAEYRVPGASQRETVFSPNGDCRREKILISFRTTRTDRANVEIVGPAGKVARTLATDKFVKRYRIHEFTWDGRRDNGKISGGGRYRVQVSLIGQDRVLLLPGKIRLHRYEPRGSHCLEAVKKQFPEATTPKTEAEARALFEYAKSNGGQLPPQVEDEAVEGKPGKKGN